MRTISWMLTGLVIPIVCLASTAALAQRVSYDFRSHEDFANIKTFAFKPVAPSNRVTAKTTTYDDPIMTERIHAAVAAQLEARGMRRDDSNPDVLVSTARTFKTEYYVYSSYAGYPYGWGYGYPYGVGLGYGYGYGYGWGGGGWGGITTERIMGTVAIDVENAQTGQLIWRGVGEKHVHESSKPASRTRRVNEAVEDIFKKFPPPPGH